ncbi:MAG: S24/S26 family peptidase [Bacillota bacterium]|nr:S24/S26 family peptidase [Bacillota bacterium]
MRKLDTYEYISMLKELVEEGHEVSVKISGTSMLPFLRQNRDTAYFKAPDRELRPGDIVFFQRSSGDYILHRICKIENNRYYLIGDAQKTVEGPIFREQIFALVTRVERNGKIVKPGDLQWDFYAKLWLRIIPLRSRLMYFLTFKK